MSRLTTAPNLARSYETIYVMRPDIDADAAEKIGGRVADAVSRENGALTKVETWGRRRLAYNIMKRTRGVYVYVKYVGSGKVVSELERNLRLSDDVLKFQTILSENDVEPQSVQVAADDVKFERLELPPLEEDRDDSRERQLGFMEPERHVERAPVDAEEGDLEPDDEATGHRE